MSAQDTANLVRSYLANRQRRRWIGIDETHAIQVSARVHAPGDDDGGGDRPGGGGSSIGDPSTHGNDHPSGGGQGIDPINTGGVHLAEAFPFGIAAAVFPLYSRAGGSSTVILPTGPGDYSDDFSADTLANFDTEGTWSIGGGYLGFTVQGSGPGRLDSWAMLNRGDYTDVRVRSVVSMANRNPILVLRASNLGPSIQAYAFEFDLGDGLTIDSVAGAAVANLHTDAGATIANGDLIEARAVGSTLSAWINGVQVASVTDSTWATGRVGVAAPLGASPEFESLDVQVL